MKYSCCQRSARQPPAVHERFECKYQNRAPLITLGGVLVSPQCVTRHGSEGGSEGGGWVMHACVPEARRQTAPCAARLSRRESSTCCISCVCQGHTISARKPAVGHLAGDLGVRTTTPAQATSEPTTRVALSLQSMTFINVLNCVYCP